jgi:hypothetical protein
MESTPNYYSITPAEVRYSKKLCANAKLLYGEISALTNKEGFCWASNNYFAKLYGVSNTSISLWVKQLRDEGFVEYEVLDNYTRKLFLKGVLRNLKGGIKKSERGVLRKVKDNSKVNNTKNNTKNTSEGSPSQDISLVIKEFEKINPACKSMYGNTTQRKHCKELIQNYTLEKVVQVINLLPKTNTIDYMPTITTPAQLNTKWVQLASGLQRLKNKQPIIL